MLIFLPVEWSSVDCDIFAECLPRGGFRRPPPSKVLNPIDFQPPPPPSLPESPINLSRQGAAQSLDLGEFDTTLCSSGEQTIDMVGGLVHLT